MEPHSFFEFDCICGRMFRLEYPLSFLCPQCGRLLVVAWNEPMPPSANYASPSGRGEQLGEELRENDEQRTA
jgi:predicted RNA-binding Zn-ribbon protein involved in translation (DUF1610 family)